MENTEKNFRRLLASTDAKNIKLALTIAETNPKYQALVRHYAKLADLLNEDTSFKNNPESFIAYYNAPYINVSNYVSYNITVEPIIAQLQFLPHVTRLDLNNNKLNDAPWALFQLLHLEELSLWGNEIYWLPEEIEQLKNLKTLNLGENKLTDLPPTIIKLQNLNSLTLSDNSFEEFPIELTHLKNLRDLDLSHNQLQIIPPQIRQLNSLYTLHLNDNPLDNTEKEKIKAYLPNCDVYF